MNEEQLLEIITNPIPDNYFPVQFLEECKAFKELDYISPVVLKEEVVSRCKTIISPQWHSWIEAYFQLVSSGKFPFLWPFRQDMIGFNFREELDDFERDDELFSLGSDPVGDWFVMTNSSGSQVFLSDHHIYDLYDGWKNPNHLVAWALRFALVDEHELAVADIMNAWEQRNDKVELDALKRIISDLN